MSVRVLGARNRKSNQDLDRRQPFRILSTKRALEPARFALSKPETRNPKPQTPNPLLLRDLRAFVVKTHWPPARPADAKHNQIRVIDESSEDYLYPAFNFQPDWHCNRQNMN